MRLLDIVKCDFYFGDARERERERYVESKIFLNELEIRFSNCDFGIKKGFDGKLRI